MLSANVKSVSTVTNYYSAVALFRIFFTRKWFVGWWSHCLLPPTLASGEAELDRVGLTTLGLSIEYFFQR